MSILNYLYNTFRLPDNSIRPGETPTDGLLSTHRVEGDQASVKIKTPYKHGTKAAYVVFNLVDVDADGEIDVVTTGIDNPYVIVMAKAMNLQDGGDML
jgi:hypothetical protein